MQGRFLWTFDDPQFRTMLLRGSQSIDSTISFEWEPRFSGDRSLNPEIQHPTKAIVHSHGLLETIALSDYNCTYAACFVIWYSICGAYFVRRRYERSF
jgi:hypothetical protein